MFQLWKYSCATRPSQPRYARRVRVVKRPVMLEEAVLVLEAAAGVGDHVEEVVVRIVVAPPITLPPASTIFCTSAAARSASKSDGSPSSTRSCVLPPTWNSRIDRIADDDRAVDERVEVFGAIGVRLPRHGISARRGRPSTRRRARCAPRAARACRPTSEMNVGAPLSIAKPASIQLLRTVISRP